MNVSSDIMSWMKGAGNLLNVTKPLLRTALYTILEIEDKQLPEEMKIWIRDNIVPMIFGQDPLNDIEQEIAHVIIKILLK